MKRTSNIVLAVVFGLLSCRGLHLLLTKTYEDTNRGNAALTTSYILLFLFSSLTLVFVYRTIRQPR